MNEVTRKGGDLIKAWLKSRQEMVRCQRALAVAQCAEAQAEDALARWILPEDAVVNEKICVWYGDSLISAHIAHDGKKMVSLWTRGISTTTYFA